MTAPTETLCGCGSGLQRRRCCGLEPALLPPPGSDKPLRRLIERAQRLEKAGQTHAAEIAARRVLDALPGQPEALAVLYRVCRADQRPEAAEALLRRLVRLHPGLLWATHELALLLLDKGVPHEAEVFARSAVRMAPAHPQSHNLLAVALSESHRPHFGEFHYRRVLEITGDRNPALLGNLASNLQQQGRLDEARALYREAAAAEADANVLAGWAGTEEAAHNFAEADALLTRAEKLPGRRNPRLLLARAVLHSRTGNNAAALDALERARELGPMQLLEKGRLLDRMGRYDDAFAAFEAGKKVCRERGGFVYQERQARQMLGQCAAFFTKERVEALPRAATRRDIAQPVFILGFPRSGTTLVEQMLSAHRNITAGDELPFIQELWKNLPRLLDSPLAYPEALAELWLADHCRDLDVLRDHYLGRAQQRGLATTDWFTDKMPLNETHLGLIHMLFPQAPLIHVQRHPLDVVLSVFANNLTHGFCCANAIESAAAHYRLVAELVAHYRAALPRLRYLEVRYEDVVDDPEAAARRMLDCIGEPFEPDCARPHENVRHARTPSYAQVAEPIYRTARERWRHYERHLGPAIEILAPLIQRLGYAGADSSEQATCCVEKPVAAE